MLEADNWNKKSKPLPINEVLDFATEAFLRCTSSCDVLIFAIDDVQWMDSLSWDVVRHLYESVKAIMIVCVSRPLKTNNISIDPEFLCSLPDEKSKASSPRFKDVKLSPLSISNVRSLLSNIWGCPEEKICKAICDYVYEKSGGMPHFVQEIARTMKLKNVFEYNSTGMLHWKDTGFCQSMVR